MPRFYACTCGHSLTAHSTCEHKKYRRGACKWKASAAQDPQQMTPPCECEGYRPVQVNAGAWNPTDEITVPVA